MNKIIKYFHFLSYLQYPFMLIAMYFLSKMVLSIFGEIDVVKAIENLNSCLLYLGIGLCFIALENIEKSPKFERKIFEKEKLAKAWLILLFFSFIGLIIIAILMRFYPPSPLFKDLPTSLFVLALGFLSYIKMNIDIIKIYTTKK